MTNTEASIRLLLSRVWEIKGIFGTITDKSVLHSMTANDGKISAPELSEKDILTFQHVVRRGIIASPELRGPNGHKVYGFLLELRRLQQKQTKKELEKNRAELIEAVCLQWTKTRNASESWEEAKQKMQKSWGNSEMDSSTKYIFNQSFLLAKKEWETQQ